MEQSERKQRELAKAAAREEAMAIDAAINGLLAHKQGRTFLWWLLALGRVGEQPFRANALQTSFNTGELNVGLQIQAAIMSANPAGYVRMLEERNNVRDRNDAQRDSASGDDSDSNSGGDPFAGELEPVTSVEPR